MLRKNVFRVSGAVAVFLLLVLPGNFPAMAQAPGQSQLHWTPPKANYPAPRYPKIQKITSVEQLMPYVRHIIERKGAEHMNVGFNIKGGEKVLFIAQSSWDPLVVEAFVRGLREKNCLVDVIIQQSKAARLDIHSMSEADRLQDWLRDSPEPPYYAMAQWLVDASKQYDWAIGATGVPNAVRFQWPMRELVASAATMLADEILDVVDRKVWEVIRQAEEIHIVDPEGTDLKRTWFPDYWQVIEGVHPTVKTVGENFGGYAASRKMHATYGPGQSEKPMIRIHITGIPQGIVLEQSNGEGVAAATSAHQGPSPRIKLTLQKNEIVKVEGGGRYGKVWGEYLNKYKSVQYPLYPRPGVGWWVEVAIGTHPKAYRAYNVMESATARGEGWLEERRRSGVIHLGFGNALWENNVWGDQNKLPSSHYHLHLYFATVTARLRNGKEAMIMDKGHLTALDDPEVRQVAAKYGDPDQLLREDWIPAIPGINVPGDYWKDYAQDPWSWVQKEHRKAYGDLLDFKPYP
ncbi:MAG: hypothetical protein HY645_06425 [Acidobacteria bacterium]|nr:hypothetical protein [Acidobacteriota bacterium]